MPYSLKINPKIIKHYRKEQKMSQVALAAAIGITERGLQKIEATGSTSSETAMKLANYFSLAISDLITNVRPLKVEYWWKDGDRGTHHILSDIHEIITKIKKSWAEYRRYFMSDEKIVISMDIKKSHYCLTASCSEVPFTWSCEFRRVWFNEKVGICWTQESELESKLMETALFSMAREEADEVIVNGEINFVDDGFYQVSISTLDQSKMERSEETVGNFQSLEDVQHRLVILLQKYSPRELKCKPSFVDSLYGNNDAEISFEAHPKIKLRSSSFQGVLDPVWIYVSRKRLPEGNIVKSTWRKEFKDKFSDQLIDTVMLENEIDNSRPIDWKLELSEQD
jgi:DNA-binding XRE family transcriptional regulator